MRKSKIKALNEFNGRYPCPICNNSSTNVFYHNPQQPIFSQGLATEKTNKFLEKRELSVSYCSRCGYVFSSLRDLSELDELYKKFYTYVPSDLSPIDVENQKRLVQFLSSNCMKGNVLEIGSGDGYFLHLLDADGWQCEGVDPSPASEIAVKKYGLKISRKYFSSKLYKNKRFDLVVLRHVLEHVNDPLSFILDIKKVLKEKGLLFVEAPNLLKSIRERNYHDFYFEHLSYFTPPFLRKLIISHSFRIIEFKTMREDEVTMCLSENMGNSSRIQAIKKLLSDQDLTQFKKTFSQELMRFSEQFQGFRENILSFITESLDKNERWVIWGAGSAGINLISLLGLTENEIEFAVDSDSNKWGKFFPGSGLCVYDPKIIKERPVDVVLIISNVYQDEIKENLKWFSKKGGKIVGLHPTFGYLSNQPADLRRKRIWKKRK